MNTLLIASYNAAFHFFPFYFLCKHDLLCSRLKALFNSHVVECTYIVNELDFFKVVCFFNLKNIQILFDFKEEPF